MGWRTWRSAVSSASWNRASLGGTGHLPPAGDTGDETRRHRDLRECLDDQVAADLHAIAGRGAVVVHGREVPRQLVRGPAPGGAFRDGRADERRLDMGRALGRAG